MTAVALALGAGALGALWGLDRLARAVVRPPVRRPEREVHELGVPFESVSIPAEGRELAGWLLTPEGSHGGALVIVAHGWGANYGTVVDIAEPLVHSGHPVLLYDVRGHGRNGPEPTVTVRDFRDDAMAVARWAAARRPDQPRVMVGHSMGAAGAMLAAVAGAPVHGLVSIAGPASVIDVTAEWLSDRGLPGALLVRLLLPFWWRQVGGTFGPLTPERRVRELSVPLLLVHPGEDRRVLRHHAERLGRASGLPVHVVEGAGHTDVLRHPETHALVLSFLRARSRSRPPS